MLKPINSIVAAALVLGCSSVPALAAYDKPTEFGVKQTEMGSPYEGHAEWATIIGRPELRLASDLPKNQSKPLIGAAIVECDRSSLSGPPIQAIEFTYRKNIEKECDPVLRIEDAATHKVATITVHQMDKKSSPGNYTVATYKLPESSHLKRFAILGEAHKKNNDGCNFEVIGIRFDVFQEGWKEPEKDMNVREMQRGREGAYFGIMTDLYN